MTILLADATNIFVTLLQTRTAQEKLAVGDYTFPAELCLESVRNFCFNNVQNLEECVLCFDKGRSFKKDIEGGCYKSNREKKNEATKYKMELVYGFLNKFIKDLTESNVFNIVSVDRVEADDSICVLAKYLNKKDSIVVWSGDVDFTVLTSLPNTMVWRNGWVRYPFYYKSENVTWNTTDEQELYMLLRGCPKDGILSVINDNSDLKNFPFGPVKAFAVMKAIENGEFETCKELKNFRERYGDDWKETFKINLKRNEQLLDCFNTPIEFAYEVVTQYAVEKGDPDFLKLFRAYNLYSLEEKVFAYDNMFRR